MRNEIYPYVTTMHIVYWFSFWQPEDRQVGGQTGRQTGKPKYSTCIIICHQYMCTVRGCWYWVVMTSREGLMTCHVMSCYTASCHTIRGHVEVILGVSRGMICHVRVWVMLWEYLCHVSVWVIKDMTGHITHDTHVTRALTGRAEWCEYCSSRMSSA